MRMLFRCFADARTQADANRIAAELAQALAYFRPELLEEPRQYWKIPEYFEFHQELHPGTRHAYDAVLQAASVEWDWMVLGETCDEECSAVWNAKRGETFLLTELRWVELILIH